MDKFRSVIQTEFRQFEETFAAILKSDNPLLNEVLDYIYAKRGKQLRPILVLLSAGLCRGITSKTIQSAVSLELMHTASLMHDDVVDDTPCVVERKPLMSFGATRLPSWWAILS